MHTVLAAQCRVSLANMVRSDTTFTGLDRSMLHAQPTVALAGKRSLVFNAESMLTENEKIRLANIRHGVSDTNRDDIRFLLKVVEKLSSNNTRLQDRVDYLLQQQGKLSTQPVLG